MATDIIHVEKDGHCLSIHCEKEYGTPWYGDARCSCGSRVGILPDAIGSQRKVVYVIWKAMRERCGVKFPWPL